MSNPYVREIGHTEDIDCIDVIVGVDYDAVTINRLRLDPVACAEFAALFTRACIVAASQPADCPPLLDDMVSDRMTNLENLSTLDDVR